MPGLRYIVAFVAACLIVAGGFLFYMNTNREIAATLQQHLREEEAAGRLPPGSSNDIKSWKETDRDVEGPEGLIFKLDISDFISKFGLVLVPVVFVLCFGVAELVGRLSQK